MSLTVLPRPEQPRGQPGMPLPPRPASEAWHGSLPLSASRGPRTGPRTPIHSVVLHRVWISRGLASSQPASLEHSFQEHECCREGPTNPCVPPSAEWPEHGKLKSTMGSVGPVGVSQMPHPRAKAHKPHRGSHICPNISFISVGILLSPWPGPSQPRWDPPGDSPCGLT